MAESENGEIAEVLAAESRRYNAQIDQDADVLEQILDDDLRYTHNNGKLDDKQSFIKLVQTIRYRKIDRRDVVVKVYGATAVVTGAAEVTTDREGVLRHTSLRFTNVWVKRAGGWRNVLWHATPVAA
jgi:ketosteroid isomerase-like protein